MAEVRWRKFWSLCISGRKVRAIRTLKPLSTAVFPLFIRLFLEAAPRFYLADQVQTVGEIELAQILCAINFFSAELKRLKQRGAAYLALIRHQPWWWSERYDNFWSYLDSHYPCPWDTQDYVVFELGNTELAKRRVVAVPTSKFAATFQAVETDDEPTTP